jgi:glucose/arabinose dehydrogenase
MAGRIRIGACLTAAVLGAGLLSGKAFAAPPDPAALLSQNRPVAASSSGGCCPAKNAVDGKSSTRWASAPGPGPQWIRVDLGDPAQLTRVRLEWDASCATAYQIQTSPDASAWTSVYATTAGDGGVDDVAVSGAGRYVRVSATQRCRTAPDKGYSLREFQVYGLRDAPSPPGPPRDPRLVAVTCVSAVIAWNPPVDGATVAFYDVYVDGQLRTSVDGDTVRAEITGLRQVTTYHVTVRARDVAGNSSADSADLVVTTPPCEGEPPTVPANLHVVGTSGTCVTLAWNPSVDNVGVVGYHVFVDGAPAATVPGPTATICGLAVGAHTAAVSAFDAAGFESARSATITFSINPGCVVCAVTTVATSTDVPWGLVTLPDGSILYAERDRFDIVHVARDGTQTVAGRVPNVAGTNGEGGLTGLEIGPTFATDHWLYVFHTSPTDNRIVRIRYVDGRLDLAGEQVLLTGIARNRFHDGGRLRFGPDGRLYAGTGDAQNGASAQNLRSLNGKILRINPDGTVPADNPFGNAVWSYGHRNPQGLAFDAQGRLWSSELGESAMDELNLISKGGNYGWPACEGTSGDCANPTYKEPVRTFPVAQASPSGIAVVRGAIWMAALRGQRLYRMVITGSTTAPPEQYFVGTYGRLRTVEPAPDGGLWLTTSNNDGHLGGPRANPVLHVTLG